MVGERREKQGKRSKQWQDQHPSRIGQTHNRGTGTDKGDGGAFSSEPEARADQQVPLYAFDPAQSAFALQGGETIINHSDTHLGVENRTWVAGGKRRVCSEEEVMTSLEQSVRDYDHTVLNGDIFETVYPQSQSPDHAAVMRDLAAKAGEAGHHLHYVVGNHDDPPELLSALETVASDYPEHFHMHPVALRLGDALFTHGDLPLRHSHYEDMEVDTRRMGREQPMGTRYGRGFGEVGEKLTATAGRHLNGAVHAPVSGVTHVLRGPKAQMDKLWQALDGSPLLEEMQTADGQTLPPVRHVVTGHTHSPYVGMEQRGEGRQSQPVYFHNSGAGLVKSLFQPVVLTTGKDRQISEVMAVDGITGQHLEQEKHVGVAR